ncbi:MAG TPA: ABC transporter permease [Solirubrobacteraceae bacterium]|nr:ABC transporter permease [Solirubrobacteraceae bacterium]
MLLAALIVFALIAPVFGSPDRIYADGISPRGLPLPLGSPGHILGTDGIGRDMLARLAWGGRTTLEFTFIANVTSIGLGAVVGIIAGFVRGVAEQVLMRITEVFLSVPTVISGLALASVIGEGIVGIVVVVTALYWAWTARVIFGEVLALRRRPFVEAAVAQGVGSLTIMRRHILPHLSSLLIVIWALNGAAVVSIGAGLSYLGAGIQPPTPEWGEMLNSGQNALEYMPHEVVEPLACIVLTVLAFVLIGDGVARRGSVSLRRSWLDI